MVRCICICRACEKRFIAFIGSLKCDDCVSVEAEDEEPLLKLLEREQRKGSSEDNCIDLISDEESDTKETNEKLEDQDEDKSVELVEDQPLSISDGQDELGEDKEDVDEEEIGHEDILADFQDEEQTIAFEFRSQQESLHASAALVKDGDLPMGDTKNKDLMMCLACGASLAHIKSGYKGRLNHIKRCSKSRGVTVKDVRTEDLADEVEPEKSPMNSEASKAWNNATMEASKPKARTLHEMLMAGARRAAKTENIKKQAKESRKRTKVKGGTFGKRSYASCPSFKKIPGTDFVCDGFQYANVALTSNYFLTHYHSDHYGGIDKNWSAGTIYCSLATANLVHEQLKVDKKYLHPLPMNEPTIVESRGVPVSVTLLNANHCPGAVMFLFEVKKVTILHVGDFRWNYEIMSAQERLSPFCRELWKNATSSRRLDELFLDTTYCDAKHDFPTKEECIAAVVEKAIQEVEDARRQHQRLLMLFGAYTIGKEAVYMSVAKRLGMKVYVDRRRHKVLSALGWPESDVAMLTTNPAETIIWVAPLGHINMKNILPYRNIRKQGFARDFDKVVGFRPTGWSLSGKRSKKDFIGTTKKDSFTVYAVPYSEHSSFPELVECLECLNPRKIRPTVGVSTAEEQVKLLQTYWSDRKANLL